jgi:uncharacterized protein
MRSSMFAVVCVFVVSIAGAGGARAASFDCKKAASRVEQMICKDVDLNSYDSQLQGAYQGALDRSNHRERVTQEQRDWMKQRDACADAKCMIAAYQQRIAALSTVSDEPAICPGASTPEVNACQAEYTKRADRELDRYLAAARGRLTAEANDNPSSTASKTALAELDASQARWLAFRKSECEAVYDWWSEGTIRGAMFEDCMQDLTKRRTEQVWSTWLSFEDSTPPLMPKPTRR